MTFQFCYKIYWCSFFVFIWLAIKYLWTSIEVNRVVQVLMAYQFITNLKLLKLFTYQVAQNTICSNLNTWILLFLIRFLLCNCIFILAAKYHLSATLPSKWIKLCCCKQFLLLAHLEIVLVYFPKTFPLCYKLVTFLILLQLCLDETANSAIKWYVLTTG